MTIRQFPDDLIQQISALFSIPLATMVAHEPGGGDIYAVLGAFIAATCTLFNAHELRRSKISQATVFIGSATVGSIGPGLLISFAYWRGWLAGMEILTWHAWAGLGLIFGLSGWGCLHTFLRSVTRYFERRSATLLGSNEEHHKPE